MPTMINPRDILAHDAARGAMFLHAYKECSRPVQELVDEMTSIIVSDETEGDEKSHAIDVIIEALFPMVAADVTERHRLLMQSDEARQAIAEMDEEEQTFANRLKDAMDKRGLTQEQLAAATGVSQPAISNMVNRNCRPQRRTISKLAAALDVDPSELWPQQ